MYKKILAPLDGSELSESSLEHVKGVAIGCGVSEVVLLRVVEPVSIAIAGYADVSPELLVQADEAAITVAKKYIAGVARRLRKEGLAVKTALVKGQAANEIINYAEKKKVDLIIMSTHGRSGISRWAFGSVADKVMRHSPVPVLVVTPSECRTG